MSAAAVLLIAWLALSGLVQMSRGLRGVTRTYTPTEGVFAVIEVGIGIWLVTVVAR